MQRPTRIQIFVAVTSSIAVLSLLAGAIARRPYPGLWGLFVLTFVAFLLEISSTSLRVGDAKGSVSFVSHLSAAFLFGGFWGSLAAGISTALSQVSKRNPPIKIAFNISQRVVSILAAMLVYRGLGGSIPPGYLLPSATLSFEAVLQDVVAFLAASFVFFAINSILVSIAVAYSSGRPVDDVWRANTLWVLGYDMAASFLALFVCWLYLKFDSPVGIERFFFLAIFLPIIGAKHIYEKLNQLQKLYAKLDEAYERLEVNVREQLAMMVKSIEARDPYTSGHSRRVSAISRAIAIDFGLSDELVEEVENAALLHDVGKIHADFAPLLQKEGKLTPEEWDLMKTHSGKSAELVGLFSRFRGHIQDSVRYHHERYDGLGYPDGLTGQGIPLGARIIMIADTIDAMTTDRPYRKALGLDVVISELMKHRGTQFDPRLVDCAVNSVSVRRYVNEQGSVTSDTRDSVRIEAPKPLRSHGSLFVSRVLGRGRQSPI